MKVLILIAFLLLVGRICATIHQVSMGFTPQGQTVQCSIGDTIRFSGGSTSVFVDINRTVYSDTSLSGFSSINWVVQGDEASFNMYKFASSAFLIGYISVNAVSILEVSDKIVFSFFPNPAKEQITVCSDKVLGDISLQDINGKVVLTLVSRNEKEIIDISKLVGGLYFISGSFGRRKLVISD